MSQQRQHENVNDAQHIAGAGDVPAGSDARLVEARAELARAYAAADAILDEIRLESPERFLEQVRQSGGQ